MNAKTWFNSFERLADIALSALAVYVTVVVLVRLSGKRSTSKMNNFDWIVTVAAGGLTASGILLESVSVADAAVALASLLGLQWATTRLTLESAWFCQLVKPRPALLVHRGVLLEDAMRRTRVSKAEIHAALREAGLSTASGAAWVILETDASLSVIPAWPEGEAPDGAGELVEGLEGVPDGAFDGPGGG